MYNFQTEGEFKCECGREFTKSQSYYAHQSYCKIHLGDRYEQIAAIRSKTSRNNITKYNKDPSNNAKRQEAYKKQSATRKLQFKLGLLKPSGRGRGKHSYLDYKGNKYLLRSTYEFIYALYLYYNSVNFSYESEYATYNDRTHRCDFYLKDFNKVIEIKGYIEEYDDEERLAFEAKGYDFELVTWSKINECYDYLKDKVDIDNLLSQIREKDNGESKSDYFEYKLI